MGRVDCTQHGSVCGKYAVDSYPTIIHITSNTSIRYDGDRSEASIVAFAGRLEGPNVNTVRNCGQLKEAASKHGLVILSTISNSDNNLRIEFESLAKAYKHNYWFYQFNGTCSEDIGDEGLYLLKRHLNKAIRFSYSTSSQETIGQQDGGNLRGAIIEWLEKESFPVYGKMSYMKLESIRNTGKLLAIAVLEEYKPARRFTASSQKLHEEFESLAKTCAQHDEQVLYGWSSDPEFVESITMRSVSTPNVILVKPDLSYHLLREESSNIEAETDDLSDTNDAIISDKLSIDNMKSVIMSATEGKLTFSVSNHYLHVVMRHILGSVNKFNLMYKEYPLLVSLIFGFLDAIIVIVIYRICFYENQDDASREELSDEEDTDEPVDERQELISTDHLKQE